LLVAWEVETSKVNGKYHEQKDEEITSICPIEGLPYVLISNAVGYISFVALPPLIFKYTKVFSYINTDPELRMAVGIVTMIYCDKNEKIFIADDHGFIKCFDISGVLRQCKNQKNSAFESVKSKSFLSPPKIADIDMQLLWTLKAHQEQIKSLEYIHKENLLITTAFDRKVKIWNSQTGKYVDAFQQNYDKKDPKPVAYKRIGTDEIYNPPFTERIDAIFSKRDSIMDSAPTRLKAKYSSNASSMGNIERKGDDEIERNFGK
jgi:WD40 repeat protein